MISRKTMSLEPPTGILVVDKPYGWTSHDVVHRIRKLFGGEKVGHTGTLDPMATGVLVLLIGKATRIAVRFEDDAKRYLAEITFGRSTDTYDAEGETTAIGNPGEVDPALLKKTIHGMAGETEQIPPMYSAVKIGGKRLYDLARSGKEVERKARRIFISSVAADVTAFPVVRLDITCSKGTYIRSIAQELGEKVGCPAHLSALRRIASGSFGIHDAVDFSAINRLPEAADELRRFILPIPELTIRE
jgi:tRNA pseudouridine55 synthase